MISGNKDVNVFLIDDSEHIRRSLRELIADMPGIRVCGEVDNEAHAMELLVTSKADVIVLDIRLMDGTGLNVLQKIKQQKAMNPYVIMFTSYPFPQHRLLARDLGADCFLDKKDGFIKLEEILLAIAGQREAEYRGT